ncbi:sugar ABC transporter permease, partial [Vibrio sinaloensis]
MLLSQTQPAPKVPASLLIMGATQLRFGHWVKGAAFLALQIVTLLFLVDITIALKGLVTLGDVAQVRNGFDIIPGDNSIFMLVEGVIALIYCFLFLCVYAINVKDALSVTPSHASLSEQFKQIYDEKFAFIMLSPAFLASIAFIILPIVITVLVSFTNYSAPHHIPPRNLVDWVGFKNFIALFELKIWSSTFFGVASWTVIWAFFATVCT